ncbi:MAG: hypothetical protein ACFFB0_00475 [Promethearchaeota archaeon]
MSETIVLHYNEFIQSRKLKLVDILMSEIIFLKSNFKKAKTKDDLDHLEYALEKLEEILNKLKHYGSNMKEKEFDEILMVIYRLFKDISMNLD